MKVVQVVGQLPTTAAKEKTTMADFKKGDIVVLKSGGPRMTVHQVHEEGDVTCVWFKVNERDQHGFDPETLKLLSERGDG